MVEVHGWITLRETYRVTDDEDIERIVTEIEDEIHRLAWSSISVSVNNGQYFIEFTRYTNHLSDDVKRLIPFYEMVGRIAEGSYGLLYIHNDEDSRHYNDFVVYRLARGKVTVLQDEFLSPLIPTVEDEDVPG
ncbi:MAG: immunity 7 family protein [Acetatifactor sp.]|nr:immunity 7 family protein [Acetatifactor sp.]